MKIEKEKLVISLIKDDLINSKLINGLNSLGLDAGHYFLHLSETIFELMEIGAGYESNELYEQYLILLKKAMEIDISGSDKPLNELAQTIYLHLKINKNKVGNKK